MIRLTILMLHLMVYGVWSSRPRILISTNCSRELFNIKLDLGKSFKGVIFAKDFSEECRVKVDYTSSVQIKLPTSGCGVRSETSIDGLYEFSVGLRIQMDEKLRQSSDLQRVVRCSLGEDLMEMIIPMGTGTKRKSLRNGRMQHDDSAEEMERIRAWLELGGIDGSGAVEVGQQTSMSVKITLPDRIDVRVIDCVAEDGIGESSQKLFDERGCPVDEQVMPALTIKKRSIEEGWSKPSGDDIVEKVFTATFPAFKFPDRERLHVNCGVQLCRASCPKINCNSDEQFLLDSETRLSRLQVFNSLAVTAPQIEIDRIRTDNGDDVTIDKYPPKLRPLHSDGILCLSTSKLALAFCVLGMIFLIAVIVSIICLLRARSKSKEITFMTTASASLFSSRQINCKTYIRTVIDETNDSSPSEMVFHDTAAYATISQYQLAIKGQSVSPVEERAKKVCNNFLGMHAMESHGICLSRQNMVDTVNVNDGGYDEKGDAEKNLNLLGCSRIHHDGPSMDERINYWNNPFKVSHQNMGNEQISVGGIVEISNIDNDLVAQEDITDKEPLDEKMVFWSSRENMDIDEICDAVHDMEIAETKMVQEDVGDNQTFDEKVDYFNRFFEESL